LCLLLCFLWLALAVFFAVVVPDGSFIFDLGFDMHGTAPEFVDIFEHFPRIFLVELCALITMV